MTENLLGVAARGSDDGRMHARWFSRFQKAIFIPIAGIALASCGGDDGPTEAEQAAIIADSTLSPAAQRINRSTRKILPDKPGKNWVFDGFMDPITKEVAWSRFWTKQLDFTGVAWDNPRNLTLITPRHVVMAKHFIRKPSTVVSFHDPDGVEVQRVLMGLVKIEGSPDVAVGILNEAMPSSVALVSLVVENRESLPTSIGNSLIRSRKFL